MMAGDADAGHAGWRAGIVHGDRLHRGAQLDRAAELSDAIGDPLEQAVPNRLRDSRAAPGRCFGADSATRLIRVPSHAAERLSSFS